MTTLTRREREVLDRALYGDPPAEVWCSRCTRPSVVFVETSLGWRALCAIHAFAADSPNFGGKRAKR